MPVNVLVKGFNLKDVNCFNDHSKHELFQAEGISIYSCKKRGIKADLRTAWTGIEIR